MNGGRSGCRGVRVDGGMGRFYGSVRLYGFRWLWMNGFVCSYYRISYDDEDGDYMKIIFYELMSGLLITYILAVMIKISRFFILKTIRLCGF